MPTVGNSPLDFFEEFCIRQQLRIKTGRTRVHERPSVPREDGGPDEAMFTDPRVDRELYEVETR